MIKLLVEVKLVVLAIVELNLINVPLVLQGHLEVLELQEKMELPDKTEKKEMLVQVSMMDMVLNKNAFK